jgi:hypothetical protein
MCAAALVVLHPLKVLSQNLQVAFLAPPSFAFDEFVTEKYCQIYLEALSSCSGQGSSCQSYTKKLWVRCRLLPGIEPSPAEKK